MLKQVVYIVTTVLYQVKLNDFYEDCQSHVVASFTSILLPQKILQQALAIFRKGRHLKPPWSAQKAPPPSTFLCWRTGRMGV
jgi:hypothetical protein